MALEGDDIHTFLKGVVSPDGLESPEQWASRVLQQKRPKFFASIVERFGSLSGLVGTNQPPNKDFTAALRKMIEDSQGK